MYRRLSSAIKNNGTYEFVSSSRNKQKSIKNPYESNKMIDIWNRCICKECKKSSIARSLRSWIASDNNISHPHRPINLFQIYSN